MPIVENLYTSDAVRAVKDENIAYNPGEGEFADQNFAPNADGESISFANFIK